MRYSETQINTLELPRPYCGHSAQTVCYQEWLENHQNCSLKATLFALVVSLAMWQTWSPAAAFGTSLSFLVLGLKLKRRNKTHKIRTVIL